MGWSVSTDPYAMGKKALARLQRRRQRILRFQELADSDGEQEAMSTTKKCGSSELNIASVPKTFSNIQLSTMSTLLHARPPVIDLTKEDGTAATDSNNEEIFARPSTSPSFSVEFDYLESLSTNEKVLVERTFRRKRSDVIVYLRDSNISLRGKSFIRLKGDNWLDDDVINGFMGMLNGRNKHMLRNPGLKYQATPKTYSFSSFFFHTISRVAGGFVRVERWTQRTGLDVTDYDLLIFPVHVGNNHWAIGTINMRDREFAYLDSLNGNDFFGVIKRLRKWLDKELRNRKGENFANNSKVSIWKCRVNEYRVNTAKPGSELMRTPSQKDGSSCGVFALKFAECASRGVPIFFEQQHIALLRQKIALDFIRTYIPL